MELRVKPLQRIKERVERLHRENELALSAFFFAIGVLFDVLTIDRIDQWTGLLQQGVYLMLLGGLLGADLAYSRGSFAPSVLERALIQRLWSYRQFMAHFLFGSLLSTYAIFYFKSSSIFSSALFLLILAGLLVANELEAFKRLGPIVKYALYSLCVASFLAYFVPVVVGAVGPVSFAASMLLTLGLLLAQLRPLSGFGVPRGMVRRDVLAPAVSVVGFFSVLYALRMIPPVPLSLQQIGIYHGVEKSGSGYVLLHERPDWKFWETGDQVFLARPGDRIFCFARVFSPARFRDQVYMHWLRQDVKGKWQTWDRIPILVTGGRDKGFRGYTMKTNFEPGTWRVQVETTDGRELGRIYLRVELDTRTQERVFKREEV